MTTHVHSPASDAVSAEPLWRLGTAYFSRKTILTAAELGVFTSLSAAPGTAAELGERLGLHPRGTADFLDALVALGMLEREGDAYRNTPIAEHYLNADRPSYVGAFLSKADARWDRLVDALRTGDPQNRWGSGPEMFTEQYRTTAAWRNFTAGMDYLNGMIGPALAEAFDWSTVDSVVDIGGARGNLAAAILRRHPHLRVGVQDLPGVEPVFHEHMTQLQLTGKVTFHPGNFFEDPMPSAQALVMSHVLHDWGVDERRLLVGAAHRALPPGGVLLICDPMIDDDRRGPAGALLTSLNMLMVTPHGSEYTVGECRSWLTEAEFTDIGSSSIGAHNTLVVARRPR
ncbi:methyltransferase [Microbispora hainanensis]|uniref:methyltransferase n=1 Tax=Microbispora hainanensis TaxID=568844 RepID=UPI001ABEF8BA|nr:methyltransferase [Microbispora hainanensis]